MGRGYNQCENRKMVESGRVPGKGRIRATIEKLSRRVPEKGRICLNTKKRYNPGASWEKIENRASTEKLSRRVPQKGRISVSTEKWWNPGEYREEVESVRVSKNCSGENRKRVQSVRVPKNGRIRVSTGKR